MRNPVRHIIVIVFVSLITLSLMPGTAPAQQSKVMTINAVARGTSFQTGRLVNVDIHIFGSSTAEDQKGLLEAFGEKGSEGLVNALEKMSSKGHIAITGTLGFDLKYIRIFRMPDGALNLRFVTDRPVKFAERWANARSMDYLMAMGEIFIREGKDKSSGTLVPASRLKLNKEGAVELEALQNPWNLTNIHVTK